MQSFSETRFYSHTGNRHNRFHSLKLALGVVWALFPALLLLKSTPAFCQNENATIRGEVFDLSGAAVPKAQVVIVNQETGVTVFRGDTDPAGIFVAWQVVPGAYRIVVTATGLKRSLTNNLVATVAQVKKRNTHIKSAIEEYFASGEIVLLSYSDEAARMFAELRANHGVKPLDALHLAIAAQAGVDLFLTNDHRLQKLVVPGLPFLASLDTDLFPKN